MQIYFTHPEKKKKRGKKAASARTEDSSQHEMETPREPEPLPITEGGNGLTEEPEEKVVQLVKIPFEVFFKVS